MSEMRERIAKVIGPYRRELPGVPWSALEDDLALALLDESEPVGFTSENELRHLRNGACASMIAYRDTEEPAYTIPLYATPTTDEIARLRARVEELEEALRKIATEDLDDGDIMGLGEEAMLADAVQVARRALTDQGREDDSV